MARVLDSRYFTLLQREREGADELQWYVTKNQGATMLLYPAEDDTCPIASVGFISNVGMSTAIVTQRRDARTDVAARGYDAFQALVGIDNGEYSLVITNLTDMVKQPWVNLNDTPWAFSQCGVLKIDILDKDVPVDATDMVNDGINEVNELMPSQSCLIQSDRREAHKCLVLRGATDAHGPISMEVDAAAPQARGSRLYLQVTPSATIPALTDLFRKGTTWRCADVFVRRVPYVEHHAMGSRSDLQVHLFGAPTAQPQPQSFSMSASLQSSSQGMRGGSSDQETWLSKSINPYMREPQSKCVDVTQSQAHGAQAAIATTGRRHVNVTSIQTSIVYDYTAQSKRAVLALSIWLDVPAFDSLSIADAKREVMMQRADLIVSETRRKYKTTTLFPSAECCICIDAPPTHVFIACGHQCVCDECAPVQSRTLSKCHLCRARVVALVPTTLLDSL